MGQAPLTLILPACCQSQCVKYSSPLRLKLFFKFYHFLNQTANAIAKRAGKVQVRGLVWVVGWVVGWTFPRLGFLYRLLPRIISYVSKES